MRLGCRRGLTCANLVPSKFPNHEVSEAKESHGDILKVLYSADESTDREQATTIGQHKALGRLPMLDVALDVIRCLKIVAETQKYHIAQVLLLLILWDCTVFLKETNECRTANARQKPPNAFNGLTSS